MWEREEGRVPVKPDRLTRDRKLKIPLVLEFQYSEKQTLDSKSVILDGSVLLSEKKKLEIFSQSQTIFSLILEMFTVATRQALNH